MIVLGIEGTAHTISCGIVDQNGILANSSRTYKNPNGGIHPREAAIHHAEHVSEVISEALYRSGLSLKDLDLIAYSRGPGLGPCLRIAATAARTLAIKSGKPIMGVNHPLGHVEIGRKLTGSVDPMLLYVSGGNTQIIAHVNGRYRVLGETMDIGLGNLLDKIARDMGHPFPGGPAIERLALNGSRLLTLPYSVKGMDTSFSGMYTAALHYLKDGESPENVSFSIQEHAFAMLVEVLERGLYQTDKQEILLAGGVARNLRLREMIEELTKDLGIKAFLTDSQYCMDNGAMIAQAGMLMFLNGYSTSLENSTVDQRFRIDQVDAPWIKPSVELHRTNMGAESRIEIGDYMGRKAVFKHRIPKSYRNHELDSQIRLSRMRNEATVMMHLKDLGIAVPIIYDIDFPASLIVYEYVDGILLRERLLMHGAINTMESIAEAAARMHTGGLSHGDFTAGNIIMKSDSTPYILDASLGKTDARPEDMAVDLYLFMESLRSHVPDSDAYFKKFMDRYRDGMAIFPEIMESFRDLEKRRRYV